MRGKRTHQLKLRNMKACYRRAVNSAGPRYTPGLEETFPNIRIEELANALAGICRMESFWNTVMEAADRIRRCAIGDKNALTFASQILNNEMLRNPNDFGDLQRGLQVYGRKVIDSEGIGILYASAGTEA